MRDVFDVRWFFAPPSSRTPWQCQRSSVSSSPSFLLSAFSFVFHHLSFLFSKKELFLWAMKVWRRSSCNKLLQYTDSCPCPPCCNVRVTPSITLWFTYTEMLHKYLCVSLSQEMFHLYLDISGSIQILFTSWPVKQKTFNLLILNSLTPQNS